MKGTGRKALLAGIPGHRSDLPAEPAADIRPCVIEIARFLDAAARGDNSLRLGAECSDEIWDPVVAAANRMNEAAGERAGRSGSELSYLSSKVKSVFGGNPLPALIISPDFVVREANEAFSRFSGINVADLPGKKIDELPFSGRSGPGLADVLRFRRHSVGAVEMSLPAGVRQLEQYNIPITGEDGAVTGILVIFYDVTRWAEEENTLRARNELLERDAAEAAVLREHIASLEEEIRRVKVQPEYRAEPQTEARAAPVNPPVPASSPKVVQPAGSGSPDLPVAADKAKKSGDSAKISEQTYDVVEFELGGERYAMDIGYAREIVEMMPITPIPRTPPYLCGVMNLRGEITNILNINSILNIPDDKAREGRKIIVLSQEASEGENMGIVVDDVESVMQVRESQVEKLGEGVLSQDNAQIKGIIKIREGAGEHGEDAQGKVGLVIWIDIRSIIRALTAGSRG